MVAKEKTNLINQLVTKSNEAFVMALEVFNKPTLKYRVEGFAFFICNAWELMLKARILKTSEKKEIYYPDNPDRTISLSEAIKKVFTNNKDPLRKNLEKIIELRNTSTHFITEEYGVIYAPLFQACVLNFRNKMLEFHDIDVACNIPDNFLTLSINIGDFTDDYISAKYSPELSRKLIERRNDLAILEQSENSPKFSISIHQDIYITKDKKTADLTVAIAGDSDSKVKIVKEMKDPSNTHNYSFKNVVIAVNNRIKTEKIPFSYTNKSGVEAKHDFNSACLTSIIKFYDLKSNEKYTYAYKIDGKTTSYSYSSKLVDFIVDQIKKDPSGIMAKIREKR